MLRINKLRERGEKGMTLVEMALAAAAAAGLAATVSTSIGALEPEADAAACRYEKRLVLNSIELAHAAAGTAEYPIASGADGLDEVRSGGWLSTDSGYWTYVGVGPDGHPSVELEMPVEGCE